MEHNRTSSNDLSVSLITEALSCLDVLVRTPRAALSGLGPDDEFNFILDDRQTFLTDTYMTNVLLMRFCNALVCHVS